MELSAGLRMPSPDEAALAWLNAEVERLETSILGGV